MSYRLFLTPKWLFGHLLAASLVVLFVNFGFWQLRRLNERQAYNALLEERLAAPASPFLALRSELSEESIARASDDNPLAYRRASATGRYDPEHEVLQRSRSYSGQPGYHVLTPLVMESGEALLIDRGWVPFEWDDPPVPQALPPESPVSLSGVLFPRQTQPGFGAKDPAEGPLEALFWIDTERLERQMPYPLAPLYLQLESQTPPQPERYPVPPEPPVIDEGPHLGYAIQWFSFALIGFVGYGFLLRKTALEGQVKDTRARG